MKKLSLLILCLATFFTLAIMGCERKIPQVFFLKISGDNQHGEVGKALNDQLVVQLVTEDGTPLVDQGVNCLITEGTSAYTSSFYTDKDGYIYIYWTLHGSTPTHQLQVAVETINPNAPVTPVTFEATSTIPATITLGNFTDSRDGEIYETVAIGNQVWMAENLRFNALGSSVNPNNPSTKYGRLYDWATLMDIPSSFNTSKWGGNTTNHQGICPSGWHVPNRSEWEMMIDTLGKNPLSIVPQFYHYTTLGIALKSVTAWSINPATNTSGLNIFPTGLFNFYDNNDFNFLGEAAFFWTSFESSANATYYILLYDDSNEIRHSDRSKSTNLSCRCVKN